MNTQKTLEISGCYWVFYDCRHKRRCFRLHWQNIPISALSNITLILLGRTIPICFVCAVAKGVLAVRPQFLPGIHFAGFNSNANGFFKSNPGKVFVRLLFPSCKNIWCDFYLPAMNWYRLKFPHWYEASVLFSMLLYQRLSFVFCSIR